MRKLIPWFLVVAMGGASSCGLLSVGAIRHAEFVRQRSNQDCGVAVLAMATGHSYERVTDSMGKLGIVLHNGLMQDDFLKLGRALGTQFEVVKPADINHVVDRGILVISVDGGAQAHALYLEGGDVFDPLTYGPAPYVLVFRTWERVLYFLREVKH